MRLLARLLLSLLIALPASAVTMDWTPVGNPGNACDPQSQGCFGAVGYSYYIGTYEVTNAQYVEFLNTKAATDPLALYHTGMGSGYGGITRSGVSGSYTYNAISGREDMPVTFVSFYDALRFANWMNNGQGSGDTETGSYTLIGGTPIPSNGMTVTRNAGATIVLTSEDEWYKAAYYSPGGVYFDYPSGSNTQTTCAAPTAALNSANCDAPGGEGGADPDVDDFTPKGSFPGSASPYGTFDQGGNAIEWNEATINNPGPNRGVRGGAFQYGAPNLAASVRDNFDPANESVLDGFRLAMIPEPGTGLLVIGGLLGLAGWRRGRA